jgi:hypothetical protein
LIPWTRGSGLIRRLVYIAFFLEVGLLLIVLPWSPFWDRNYFVSAWPSLGPIVTNNFLRGAVTGLGFVDLYAGFADLALVFAARGSGPRRTMMRAGGPATLSRCAEPGEDDVPHDVL